MKQKLILHFRLSAYGKRRSGMTDLDEAMTRELTEWEAMLVESQEILETRGKVSSKT